MTRTVFEVVDVNAYNTFSCFPGMLYLVLNPWTVSSFGADKYDYAGTVVHNVVNPALNSCVALAFYFFPFVGAYWLIAIYRANVSDYLGAPTIVGVMETIKDLSFRHRYFGY